MSLKFWSAWARRFKGPLALISVLTLFASVATLAVPWLAGQLLSGLLPGSDPAAVSLPETLALLVAALVAMTALTIAAGIVSESVSAHILTELREDIHAHVQRLPIGFHEGSRRGDVLALTSYEVGNLSEFLASTLATAPALLLTALGAIALLFALDPAMALVVPVIVPVFYFATRLAGRRLRSMSRDLRAAEVEMIALAERDLDMLPATKSFAVEAHVCDRFARAARVSRDSRCARRG